MKSATLSLSVAGAVGSGLLFYSFWQKGKKLPNKKKKKTGIMRVIGVQSGNAADGLDVGIFDFEPPETDPADPRRLIAPLKYTTLANKTFHFSKEDRAFILSLRSQAAHTSTEYAQGNYQLGRWFAKAANDLLAESGLPKDSVHLVGSHGQSICGHPHWEFGDVGVMAQLTGITTAGDFRPADVAAGGTGSPCTCTYDSIMLRPPAGNKKWRIALNFGGTCSVTFLPPWGAPGVPIGLDPGLGVFFMDLCVEKIDPSLEFDENGEMARAAHTHEELLEYFFTYQHYHKDLPVCVGVEDFSQELFNRWRAKAQSLNVSDQDLLATLTELTARQCARACVKYGGPNIVNGAANEVIIRGGICNNGYFVERLQVNMDKYLGTPVTLLTLDQIGINPDSWENAMYAIMGYLCVQNIYNFVPSCTGANYPVVGGKIAPGNNFSSLYQLLV